MPSDLSDDEGHVPAAAGAGDSSMNVPTDTIFRELSNIWHTDPACHDLLQYRRLATAHQYCRLYGLIRANVAPGSRVLDWGCGNGHVSYGLTRWNFAVSGFSFHDFGLRRRLGRRYEFKQGNDGDPATLPFATAAFDAVMSVGVLEHVRETGGDEVASLREIHRVLRPGGVFLCYHLPNRYSLIEALTRRIPSAHSHRFRYTRADIERLCQASGLELTDAARYGALPRNLWHRTPRWIGDSVVITWLWDFLDAALRPLASPVLQNYHFVARKAAGPTVPGTVEFAVPAGS